MMVKKIILIICIIANTFVLFSFLKEKKYFYIAIILFNYYLCINGFKLLKKKK